MESNHIPTPNTSAASEQLGNQAVTNYSTSDPPDSELPTEDHLNGIMNNLTNRGDNHPPNHAIVSDPPTGSSESDEEVTTHNHPTTVTNSNFSNFEMLVLNKQLDKIIEYPNEGRIHHPFNSISSDQPLEEAIFPSNPQEILEAFKDSSLLEPNLKDSIQKILQKNNIDFDLLQRQTKNKRNSKFVIWNIRGKLKENIRLLEAFLIFNKIDVLVVTDTRHCEDTLPKSPCLFKHIINPESTAVGGVAILKNPFSNVNITVFDSSPFFAAIQVDLNTTYVGTYFPPSLKSDKRLFRSIFKNWRLFSSHFHSP